MLHGLGQVGVALLPAVFAVTAGCTQLLGVEEGKDRPPAGSGAGGEGGAGAPEPCAAADDCPGSDTDCRARTCVGGACGFDDASAGIRCDDGGGRTCDGQGTCAECLTGAECLSGVCRAGVCDAPLLWARTWGDPEGQYGADVTVDSAGAAVVTGSFFGSIPFGPEPLVSAGEDDGFLVKLDASGGPLWSLRFGDAVGRQAGTGVATDPAGDVLVAGDFAGTINLGEGDLASQGGTDVFVAKFDASGQHMWSKSFGGPQDDSGSALAVDKDGHTVVVGAFQGGMQIGNNPLSSAGATDIFIAKLNGFGSPMWSRAFGDSDHQRATTVAVDADKNILVAGNLTGAVDFGGGAPQGTGGAGAFLVKLDAVGNYFWSLTFGQTGSTTARGVVVDPAGDVFLLGSIDGSADFGDGTLSSAGGADLVLAKFGATGDPLWSKRFGDAADQTPGGIALDSAGNVIITGTFSGTLVFGSGVEAIAGNVDVFVARIDGSSGAPLEAIRFAGDGAQRGEAVATGGADTVVIGSFEGHADFGKGPIPSQGQSDLFVARLAPF